METIQNLQEESNPDPPTVPLSFPPIPPPGWDQYLLGLSKAQRRRLRKQEGGSPPPPSRSKKPQCPAGPECGRGLPPPRTTQPSTGTRRGSRTQSQPSRGGQSRPATRGRKSAPVTRPPPSGGSHRGKPSMRGRSSHRSSEQHQSLSPGRSRILTEPTPRSRSADPYMEAYLEAHHQSIEGRADIRMAQAGSPLS